MKGTGNDHEDSQTMEACRDWQRRDLMRQLSDRIPPASCEYVVSLLMAHPVDLIISRPRRTRLGDYRPPHRGRVRHRISVNEDLNPYAFLTTLLHEIAHLEVAVSHRRRVRPHGVEWKRTFGGLLEPVVAEHGLPEDVADALRRMILNPRASSCSDRHVLAALTRYDETGPVTRLDDLPPGSIFRLESGKTFRHRRRLRTWHVCTELRSRRAYRVRGSSRVERVDDQPPVPERR
jgi:SprT protein